MIFKQAFRIAFITLIWKQYKAIIVSTTLLFVFFFIISNLHQDYLTATSPDNIDRMSFVYKWGAYIAGVVAYFTFHALRRHFSNNKKSTKEKITESQQLNKTDEDPFAAIRERKKLRSRADFLMDKDKNKKK